MEIIKKNLEYKSVYSCNNSVSDYNLVIFMKKNNKDIKISKEMDSTNRYGFTSAKKIKHAVDRNRIRRRLKEIIRLNECKIKKGYDLVFMARINAVEADYKTLEKSFFKVLKRSNLFKDR